MSKFGVAAAAGVVALSALTLPAANAYEGNDLNNAHIVNYQPTYQSGAPIEVTASGLQPNTKYLVGQCTWKSHKIFWWTPIPACTDQNPTVAVSDAAGNLTATIYAIAKGDNVHAKIPFNGGQPDQINYSNTPAEIVIIQDHGKGFRGKQAADTAETFYVKS